MKKKDFEKLEAALIERGYKKYQQHWRHEDYVLGASFHREDNHWDNERSGYKVLLSIYDYTMHTEFYYPLPKEQRDRVRIEVTVMVSRVIDERMDLTTSWADDTTIEEIECMADSFYRWVLTAYPEPRKVF